MTTPVHPEQLRISVEMGEAYVPTDRLRAALAELAAALSEAEAGEVEGFKMSTFEIQDPTFISYDSLAATGSKGSIAPKIGSQLSSQNFPKLV